MNIITNDKMIKRNGRLAQIVMLVALAILAGGMFLSFRFSEGQYFYLSLVALLFGFILSQVGIFLGNRFGRHPRPDELLNQSLKGLDTKYTLYHYTTPVPHLLLGPAGLWILLPRAQKGKITYANNRWHHKGGNLYLKLFAQDSLGRPDLDFAAEREKLERFIQSNLPTQLSAPQILGALVLTHPDTIIDIPEDASPPAETVSLDKLKDTIRKNAKTNLLQSGKITELKAIFPSESI